MNLKHALEKFREWYPEGCDLDRYTPNAKVLYEILTAFAKEEEKEDEYCIYETKKKYIRKAAQNCIAQGIIGIDEDKLEELFFNSWENINYSSLRNKISKAISKNLPNLLIVKERK